MTDRELERAIVRLEAGRHWRKMHPMPARQRLQATWAALTECRYALEGALRGWRC